MTTRDGKVTWSSPEACVAAHTAGGALLGAAAGALLGGLVSGGKGAATGAVAGAAGGAFMGFAYSWGKCFAAFTKVSSRPLEEDSREKGSLSHVRETSVRIVSCALDPVAVAPGGKPTFTAHYYVLTPTEREVWVSEQVVLKAFNPDTRVWEEVGKTPLEKLAVNPGKRLASSEIPVPSSAKDGEFMLVFRVMADGFCDEKESLLTISTDEYVLVKKLGETSGSSVGVAKRSDRPRAAVALSSGASSKSVSTVDPFRRYFVSGKNGVRLRKDPDTRAKVVGSVVPGKQYVVTSLVNIGGRKWAQVEIDAGGSAWVAVETGKIVEE